MLHTLYLVLYLTWLSWCLLRRARMGYFLKGTGILVGKSGSVGKDVMLKLCPTELAVAFAFGTSWFNDKFCRLFERLLQHM